MHEGNREDKHTRACVVGIGGGGLRVVDRFRLEKPDGVDVFGFDTDVRDLERYIDLETYRLGRALMRGLGCGGDEEMGRLAADSDRNQISDILHGYGLIVLVGCLGRGFASGALPAVASMAGETGTPTVSIVSTPFEFEGKRPSQVAKNALSEVRRGSDCVVVLPNDLLFQETNESDRADQLFEVSDSWVGRAVFGLLGPMFRPGTMSVDLATFRSALKGDVNRMHFSTCRVSYSAGLDALKKSLFECPFRSAGIDRVKADRLLVSVGTGGGLSVADFSEIADAVTSLFSSREEAVVGLWEEESLGDSIEVSVFARTYLSETPIPERRFEKVMVHPSKLDKKKKASKEKLQTEFDSLLEHNERGLFGRLDVEDYNGVDLDKPTFLRKGIKIPMPKN
ncbi:MAG: hypothetical protein AAGJ81_14040 [Verrucomicrobiota bacterium]